MRAYCDRFLRHARLIVLILVIVGLAPPAAQWEKARGEPPRINWSRSNL